MKRYIKQTQDVEAAINPQTVALIAEVFAPIIIELLGKYWETHSDKMVDDISKQAIREISQESENDENVGFLQDLIDSNLDAVLDQVKELISKKMSQAFAIE